MDNRKVYRSYRDKVKSSSSPYPAPSLFSRVKRIFSPTTSWNHPSKEEVAKERSSDEIKPFKFAEPTSRSNSISHKLPGAYDTTTETPNNVLSAFFQEKGNKPLTNDEYQRVMSLMNQSRTNSPDTSRVHTSNTTRDPNQSINSTVLHNGKAMTTLRADDLGIFSTPYAQKTLRNNTIQNISHNDSSFISSSAYHPTYHTINDSFSSRRIPTVKRVYQFSGLPSPYRTRIKAPSYSRKSTKAKNVNVTMPEVSIENSFSATQTSRKRPISKTANTLLSILDGDNEKETKEGNNEDNSKIKLFSNPYSSQRPKRTRVEGKKPQEKNATITADDIKNTMSFDKSEALPELTRSKLNDDISTKDTETEVKDTKTVSEVAVPTKKAFDFSIGKEGFSTVESDTEKKATTFKFAPSTAPNPAKPAFVPVVPVVPAAFTLPSSTIPKVLPTVLLNEAAVEKIAETVAPSVPSFNPTKSFGFSSYIFPEVEKVFVQLDPIKVEQYKPLFEF